MTRLQVGILKNIINFCDGNNVVHCVSELLDYYMECCEVKSEKRKLLAKETIENICHAWKDRLPKELLSEIANILKKRKFEIIVLF